MRLRTAGGRPYGIVVRYAEIVGGLREIGSGLREIGDLPYVGIEVSV